MTKLIFVIFSTAFVLFGCDSEQEKIHKKQIETCKKSIQSGQEPTEFCLSLLPEYRNIAQVPQVQQYAPPEQIVQQSGQVQEQYAQPSQQVVQQPPQVVYAAPQQPQTVIQQQPVQQDNTLLNFAAGALAGHAISNMTNNNSQPPIYRDNHYYNNSAQIRPPVTNITKNITVIPQLPKPVAPVTKNYMDTGKLSNSYKYPSASVPKNSSSMNMSRLGSSGKR